MTHANNAAILLAGVAGVFLLNADCIAQESQSIEQAANDPTASLMNIQISDWYTFNYHNADFSDNTIVLRSAIPFKIGAQNNIFRVTLPIITDNPILSNGLSDSTIFNLSTFDRSWGRFGVGAVALLPTGGSSRGAEKWGLGPAFGFVNSSHKGFLFGLFNQNLFSVAGDDSRADVNVSIIQPILNKSLGKGWSVGASEMSITYDWENSRWASLPLGMSLSKIHKFGKTPVQFSGQYEHNFQDQGITGSDTLRFSVKILMPTR
jgi:hypothetical protein